MISRPTNFLLGLVFQSVAKIATCNLYNTRSEQKCDSKFWKRQVYIWLPIRKWANNKNNKKFLIGAETYLDVDIPSKTKFTIIIIIISFKLHLPSIKSNILTKTSFYGQKMFQQNYFKEMLTNTQGELHGAQKETNFWHHQVFRSCSFWKFSEKGASRLPLNGNNLNTLLLILPNNKKNIKKTRTTSIEKSFTTFNYYLVKDAIVDRRLFSITKILLLLVAWLIE